MNDLSMAKFFNFVHNLISSEQEPEISPQQPPDPVETLMWFCGLLLCSWLFVILVKWILRWIDGVLSIVSYGMYIGTIVVFLSIGIYSILYCLGNSSECIVIMDNIITYFRPLFMKFILFVRSGLNIIISTIYHS